MNSRSGVALGSVLLGGPLLVALIGPLVAGSTRSSYPPLLPPSAQHPLGTDVLGRDVLALVLTGGTSVVVLAVAALVLSYSVGVLLALAVVGQRRRWVDEGLLRLLDVVLALPGLLVLLVLAAADRNGPVPLVLAVAVLQVPPVVRLTRSAALEPACRTVVEAMLQQGEPWWRVHIVHTGRSVLGPVLVDAGHRLNVVLGLLASANFLGIGLAPDTSGWAVHIERNREALFLQPAAVLVPCALLASLCVGINLVVDSALAGREVK